MSIILRLRDGNLIIPKEYYTRYLDFDWFFSKMIEFDSIDTDNTYTLWEDKNAILSIFDSLKFSKLVVHEGVSNEYLENLCDMWLVPKWIKIALNDRRVKLENEKYDYLSEQNKVYQCKNCFVGFKLRENKIDSCKRHMGERLINNRRLCCGSLFTEPNAYCVIGYHVHQ
jgi:hypothetical protein